MGEGGLYIESNFLHTLCKNVYTPFQDTLSFFRQCNFFYSDINLYMLTI